MTRTANLLGALAVEIVGRVERGLTRHPNETTSSAAALSLLATYGGGSNGQISRALGLSHTATLRLLDKLEADGLVETRPGRDARTTALHLTSAGSGRAKALLVARCLILEGVLNPLTGREREQFAGLLAKLLSGLVQTQSAGGHICRLCDEAACPPEQCPVHVSEIDAGPAPSHRSN